MVTISDFFPDDHSPLVPVPTGVTMDTLEHIGTVFSTPPTGFTLHGGELDNIIIVMAHAKLSLFIMVKEGTLSPSNSHLF